MLGSVQSLSVLMFFTAVCSVVGCGQSSDVPEGWKEVEKCGLRFLLPESMEDQQRHGKDSCVAVYSDERLELRLDYGWYSAVVHDDSYVDLKEQKIRIDGKKGRFATFRDRDREAERQLVARIYVPLDRPFAFNMHIYYRNPKDLETARSIFESIRFVK